MLLLNTTIDLDYSSHMNNGSLFQVEVHGLELHTDGIKVTTQGLSDFSSSIADLITYVGNTALHRVNSIVSYVGPAKLTEVTNAILA
jgi:hypothetical protein